MDRESSRSGLEDRVKSHCRFVTGLPSCDETEQDQEQEPGGAMYDDILYEVQDPVGVITLNQPETLNAWTLGMDGEIRDAMRRAENDPSVVGIVITGAGRGFCAGANVNYLSAAASSDAPKRDDAGIEFYDGTEFGGRFTYLMASPKPIIAAVNGPVAGMGFPFALCADIRVVSSKALFVTAFAHRGLVAEWGLSWLLPRLVGPAAALDMLFTSRRVGGEEAHRLGLANYLVDGDDLLSFCRSYVEDLAKSGSPASYALMKRQVYEQLHRGLAAAELDAQLLMKESFDRPDFGEGVRSFVEKRPPEFPRIGDASK